MPWITVINYHHTRDAKHAIQGIIERLVQIPDIPWLLELSLQGGNVTTHSWSMNPLSSVNIIIVTIQILHLVYG
ncbi:hypothetical protein BDQ94DRAFT_154986, partial [Aspergillus welwitschiae]